MANEQNLIPFNQRTEKEQRELARKAGIASGIARREKRTMKELLDIVLAQEVTNANGETLTRKEIIAVKLANKSCNGDLKAIGLLSELIGERVSKAEITGADGKPLIPEDSRTQAEKEAEIARLLKKGE